MSLTKRITASGNVHMLSCEIQANPSSAFFFMDACISGAISGSTYVTFVDVDQNETES